MAIVESTEANAPAVSWGAILAGAFAAASLSVVFVTLGSAVGFATISPWSNSGVSATTVQWTAGAYLVLTSLISSAVGGYIAGRLRTKWPSAMPEEVTFRDTAHGFIAWAFAAVMGVIILGTAATSILGSATSGAATGAAVGGAQAAQGAPTDYFVDTLLRPGGGAAPATGAAPAPAAANNEDLRAEVGRIFTRSLTRPEGLTPADRSYLAQVVASRTGQTPAEAEKRVTEVVNSAKAAIDEARKFTAALAGWLTLAMFAGAFAAAMAAIEGGQLRDGRWRGVLFAKNYRSNP
jgi:hypothetical protein